MPQPWLDPRAERPAEILQQLKADAPATTTFVGLEYDDPFLIPPGRRRDNGCGGIVGGHEQAQRDSGADYQSTGTRVVDVPSFFQIEDNTPVVLPNVGTIPENVYRACLLTWMCKPAPFGPDDHPNNAGYMEIAEAIMDQLPGSWHDYPPK